jgi:hypothetical protein
VNSYAELRVLARARTPAGIIKALRAGEPEILLVIPGWLSTQDRHRAIRQVTKRASRTWQPVHARWVWNREDTDGKKETVILIWPCTVTHGPLRQCRSGEVIHGNKPVDLHRLPTVRHPDAELADAAGEPVAWARQ